MLSRLITIVLVLIACVNGRVYDRTWTVTQENPLVSLSDNVGFGFLSGGQVVFTLGCNGTGGNAGERNGTLSLCSRTDYDATRERNFKQTLCTGVGTSICSLRIALNSTQGSWTVPVGFSEFLYPAYINCAVDDPLVCSSSIVLLNPGGEQLSSDEIALPTIYIVFVSLWAASLVAWSLAGLYYRRYSNHAHKLITAVALVVFVAIVLNYVRYLFIERDGFEPHTFLRVRQVVQSLALSLTILLLLVLSDGYGVMRAHLEPISLKWFLFLTGTLFGTLIAFAWIHGYFLGPVTAVALCSFGLMIKRSMLHASLANTHLQRVRPLILQHNAHTVSGVPLWAPVAAKAVLMNRLRLLVLLFVVCFSLATAVSVFVIHHESSEKSVLLSIDFITFASLLVLYRLRDFSLYENLRLVSELNVPSEPQHKYVLVQLPSPRKEHSDSDPQQQSPPPTPPSTMLGINEALPDQPLIVV